MIQVIEANFITFAGSEVASCSEPMAAYQQERLDPPSAISSVRN